MNDHCVSFYISLQASFMRDLFFASDIGTLYLGEMSLCPVDLDLLCQTQV